MRLRRDISHTSAWDGGPADDPRARERATLDLGMRVAYATASAVLLTLCDYAFHTRTGVLGYSRPARMSLLPGHPTAEVFGGFLVVRMGGRCDQRV